MIHIRDEIFLCLPIQTAARNFMIELFMFCVMKGLDNPIMIHVKYMLNLTYHIDWLKYVAKQKNRIIEMTN